MSAESGSNVSKSLINLPASLVLTKEGFDFMARGKTPLTRVPGMGTTGRDGLKADKGFHAQVVQKMAMNSYLEEIYVAQPDLLSRRAEIISTNNLIVYAILYKKLSPTLAEKILESNVVKDFNRKNPKHSLVDFRSIPKAAADELVTKKKDLFDIIFNDLKDHVDYRLSRTDLPEEDKTTRKRALDKFVRWIDNRIWFLYHILYQSPLQGEMEKTFADIIYTYLDNTSIATHLSNLVMEFVQNAEKAHFERLVVRNNLSTSEMVDVFLRDSKNRGQVIELAKKNKQMLEISWSMNPGRAQVGKQYRILIRISNYGMVDEQTRAKLSKKMQTNTDGIALGDFYNQADPEKLGAGLGLLYNSYLEDFCRQKKIKYFCNLFPEPAVEKTTVQIEITL